MPGCVITRRGKSRQQVAQSAAHAIIAAHLPPAILPALGPAELERIRLHLSTVPAESLRPRIGREDYLAAFGVFLLVFLCLVPVAVPFLLVDNVGDGTRRGTGCFQHK